MELYNQTSYELSRHLTMRYSTSFSMSSRLFSKEIQPHIYAIYGLVRIADEIVDTYMGSDAAQLLDDLEQHTEASLKSGYSPNPIVHAFAQTARQYGIDPSIIRPFFDSMRLDLSPQDYNQELYNDYIYGSAEVIGLMCLKVFTDGNTDQYDSLAPGARALGSAYQKVNFLRDLRDDYSRLGRAYFPGVNFNSFTNQQKQAIEADIEQDFTMAREAIARLPRDARPALKLSYDYYHSLLTKLKAVSVDTIKSERVRVPNHRKLLLLARRLIWR